jgi:hypothetical protein
MWIFTSEGFVSAVYKYHGVQVRSRDLRSLNGISAASGEKVVKTPAADYPYRVTTDRQTFAQWLCAEVMRMSYPNFKSEVSAVRGSNFVHPLHEVWEVMHMVEDREARAL